MRKVLSLFLTILFVGCGASTQYVMYDKNLHLQDYRKVYVFSSKLTGAISTSNYGLATTSANISGTATTSGVATGTGQANLSGKTITSSSTTNINSATNLNMTGNTQTTAIAGGSTMSGLEQAQISVQKMKFELAKIGFVVVNEPDQADALVDFNIGAVRFDPLAGWIADEASVVFLNNKGETLAHSIADTRFITPTTNSVIRNLSNRIKAACLQ